MRAKRSRPQALGPMTVGESRPGTGQVNVDGQEAEKRQTIQQRWTKRWKASKPRGAETESPKRGTRITAGATPRARLQTNGTRVEVRGRNN